MKFGLSLKEHSASIAISLRLLDLTFIVASGLFSHWLRFNDFALPTSYRNVLVLGGLICAICLSSFGAYRAWRGASFSSEVRCVVSATLTAFILLLMSAFFTQTSDSFSRLWVFYWLLSSTASVLIYRFMLRRFLAVLRSKGFNIRRVIIIGDDELGQSVASKLILSPGFGLEVQGFITNKPCKYKKALVKDLPVLGSVQDLDKVVNDLKTDQVWIALPLSDVKLMEEVQSSLATSPVTVRMVPDIFGFQLLNHSLSEVAGLPVINLSTSHMLEGKNRFLKEVEDKLLSIIILTMISPLLIFLAAGVKLSSPGPVFYRQERVSWNGRTFKMLKFRSMTVDSEKSGIHWGGAANMSVTKFGAFIRKTSLDELPQFFNVLKGDMSIVGPRPERTLFVEQFKNEIPRYMQKHTVKAGITGWAQVNGWRGDTDLKKRVEYDLYYIENWSLWFDFKIIVLTFFNGFVHKNSG